MRVSKKFFFRALEKRVLRLVKNYNFFKKMFLHCFVGEQEDNFTSSVLMQESDVYRKVKIRLYQNYSLVEKHGIYDQ